MQRSTTTYLRILIVLLLSGWMEKGGATPPASQLPALIPYPKEVNYAAASQPLAGFTRLIQAGNPGKADRFTAALLQESLQKRWGHQLQAAAATPGKYIRLERKKDKTLGEEGYRLTVREAGITISSPGEAGLFYGVQTLLQLIEGKEKNATLREVEIRDWPDTKVRAAHYDTKHHQDTKEYVQQFIRELAASKMNMLVWEWEDKFLYPSHPEIGAPGAFTMAEMQELTRYAQQYHVQLVPLVQGLGHVGFILKWPQFAHLREVPASNFEFCPLKEASYQLLMDLWKDAMEATPGSKFIHIGSDETYELGKCENCSKKQAEIGRSGLYHLFLGKSAELLKPHKRGVMAWEAPMGWAKGRLNIYHGEDKATQQAPVVPHPSLIMTESYSYETPDLAYAKQAKALGYSVYAYDPNPGIEQLFLPYFFVKNGKGKIEAGALETSVKFLQENLGSNVFDGVIRTNWDDSGLPMQAWSLCFATTAAYSWNVKGYSLEAFTTAFMRNWYGAEQQDMTTLYRLLNEAAYFYMESFERRVWAWGDIGKTHLPDLPRGDALEYDPFWAREYADRLDASKLILAKMDSAVAICEKNIAAGALHSYDIEVLKTLAELAKHTAQTYFDLESLETSIKQAHLQRFVNIDSAYYHLLQAEKTVAGQLARRKAVFKALCQKWEETRLPKGMSTPAKTYFFEQERTRHFANRVAGMEYLIYDEQLLDLEGYLEKLKAYNDYFRQRFQPTLQP
ncbi:beta-N-acetylhexosaminidase [Flavihumibacter sp. CACIAM 22H1]|uniref:beta-N-acetylhexosaminidase n=1 Tax=Flavihumibacter sp. CACIAM 22H1 TaxID=1812911 RepID=UPI000B1C4C07|nr:beta-N-acetylhexosaminidase [Flavihumibacter sp. CACIAM 22H1]